MEKYFLKNPIFKSMLQDLNKNSKNLSNLSILSYFSQKIFQTEKKEDT